MSALWLQNTIRQDRSAAQRDTNSICLRTAVRTLDATQNINDVMDCTNTIHSARCPVIMNWLQQFAGSSIRQLKRVLEVRLQPYGRVYPHVDKGEYYRLCDRYHLVVSSPEGSQFVCGDEAVTMREGELWWIDKQLTHEAINPTNSWRIHVIFDLY